MPCRIAWIAAACFHAHLLDIAKHFHTGNRVTTENFEVSPQGIPIA